jgi:hypothetical protein
VPLPPLPMLSTPVKEFVQLPTDAADRSAFCVAPSIATISLSPDVGVRLSVAYVLPLVFVIRPCETS